MNDETVFFTHPLGMGADPSYPHLTLRAARKNFSQHPASKTLWDVWNSREVQKPKHSRPRKANPTHRRFGASTVAWKVTNHFRYLRSEGQTPEIIEQWWTELERYLTEKDWADLRIQASRLWSKTPPAVRDRFNLSKDDCYNFVLLKVVDDTFTGLGREPFAMKHLGVLYPDVAWVATDNNLDAGSGFDAAGFTNGHWTHVASVKPTTWRYFATDGGHKMWVNRHKEHVKHEAFLARHPDLVAVEISGEVEKQDWVVVPVLGRPCRICDQELPLLQ